MYKELSKLEVNDLIESLGLVEIWKAAKYLNVMSGGPSLLTVLSKSLNSAKKQYRANGDEVTAAWCKMLSTGEAAARSAANTGTSPP